jgi:hypothetical protein
LQIRLKKLFEKLKVKQVPIAIRPVTLPSGTGQASARVVCRSGWPTSEICQRLDCGSVASLGWFRVSALPMADAADSSTRFHNFRDVFLGPRKNADELERGRKGPRREKCVAVFMNHST